MPIDPAADPDFAPLPPPRPVPFGTRVRAAVKNVGAKLADAWHRAKTFAEDDAPVLADHVWNDVLAHVRSHGLDSVTFDHARAAALIAAKILADRSHVAVALTAHLAAEEAEAAVTLAVRHALRYLAAIGYAGKDEPAAVAGKIEPKPDGPERAA